MRCKLLFNFVLIILFSATVSASLNVTLSDQGTGVRTISENTLLSSGDLRIEIWDALSGGRDRKSTRLNSSHIPLSRMPSSA